MRKISIAGVLLGGIVDIVATNLLMIPVIAVAASKMDLAHVVREQMTPALVAALQDSPSLYVASFVLGAAASVLGGYVAARIAKRHYLLNGALSAYLCVASSLYALGTGNGGTIPVWQHLAFLPLSPVLGAIGGYLRARKRAGGEAASIDPTAA